MIRLKKMLNRWIVRWTGIFIAHAMIVSAGMCIDTFLGYGSTLSVTCLGNYAMAADSIQESVVPALRPGKRTVFLGDSITNTGGFVTEIDRWQLATRGKIETEIINLGLSSETVSGLSEPGHPFPRPVLGERLARVIERAKPDHAILCYGMNDGVYMPPDEMRMKAFQLGLTNAIETLVRSGISVTILTPPPFDALPIEKTLGDQADPKLGYTKPYRRYDDVLESFAGFERTLAGTRSKGHPDEVSSLEVLDIRKAIQAELISKRTTNPQFTFAADGVHLNAEGHAVIASSILVKWVPASATKGIDIPAPAHEKLSQRMTILRDAWMSHIGHKRPGVSRGLPLEEATEKAKELEIAAADICAETRVIGR